MEFRKKNGSTIKNKKTFFPVPPGAASLHRVALQFSVLAWSNRVVGALTRRFFLDQHPGFQ
jgi:hypothetical protein